MREKEVGLLIETNAIVAQVCVRRAPHSRYVWRAFRQDGLRRPAVNQRAVDRTTDQQLSSGLLCQNSVRACFG